MPYRHLNLKPGRWSIRLLWWFLTIAHAVNFDCNPCISRNEYTLKAILHGTSDDDFWLQVQSAMRQAASDMGVKLELELRRSFNGYQMAQEIESAARNPVYDALIVTIPDELVEESVAIAIEENKKPIFGMNLGYEVARQLGVLGFAAQDELVAGVAAAKEFLRLGNITNALFVNNDPSNSGLNSRYNGFKEEMAPATADPAQAIRTVDLRTVDASNQFEHVTAFQSVFENCPYDAVLLGGVASLDVAVAAMESNNCVGKTLLGSFDATPDLYTQITNGRIAFGVSQQPYLQAVLPVYFAALYVTTGKALAIPMEDRVYLSGPFIINSDNVPTDTLQECAADAFPICPGNLAPNGDASRCECTDRSSIRIGGVLHGVTTDAFWDPVFASAKQAAIDMGVELDLIRFTPSEDDEDVFRRMAARITTLCEGGVDGIFVSIPSDAVVQAIERCQELLVPVISVNAGGETSQTLGLMNHIGMLEYSAGYGAAERLIEAGMMQGFCLNHAPDVEVTKERCAGFEAAIADHGGDVIYKGEVEVPSDNKAQYQFVVEDAVGDGGDWQGLGILLLGPSQFEAYRENLAEIHPAAIVGAFDINADLLTGLEDGVFLFGIDQQPFLQGNMPVILLALEAYTKQSLKNHFVETGPHFVEEVPSAEAKQCEESLFLVCPDRPSEEMNMIPKALNIFSFVLCGILVIGSAMACAWTYYYREKWVVKISQPVFLYLMLFGIVLSSLSIPFLGVETGYRYMQDKATGQLTDEPNPEISKVDAACMLVPWFYGLGFGVTFSAIFAKIQRVKLIYLAGINMQRKRVTIKDVMSVMIVMLVIEFGLLLSWQLTSPYRWTRTVEKSDTDEGFPLESVGVCESESGSYFYLSLILFHVVCLIYALILSWQTRDINSEYAESSYLFLAVMFMFQVQCLAVPILALVQGSPDVFLFVQALAIFSQNFTVLVLIFGPKMYKVFLGQADPSGGHVAGRGNNPRLSLSNRPAAAGGERRTSLLSASGGERLFRRTESGDGEGSTQFFNPSAVTFKEDISSAQSESDVLESAGKKLAGDVALKQFERIPGDKTSSFRHSTEVWMESGVPKDSSEVSAVSNHFLRTNSIKEESQQEVEDMANEEGMKEVVLVEEISNEISNEEGLKEVVLVEEISNDISNEEGLKEVVLVEEISNNEAKPATTSNNQASSGESETATIDLPLNE